MIRLLVRGLFAGALLCVACGESETPFTPPDAGPGENGGEGAETSAGGSSGRGGSTGGSSPAAGRGGAAAGGMSAGGQGQAGAAAGAGSSGIPLDDAPTQISRDVCDKVYECCSAEELAELPLGIGESESACQLGVAVYLTLVVDATRPSLTAGRITYDGAALSECLEEYGSAACDILRSLEATACPSAFLPQVELGSDCGINADCIDGYCDGANDATNPVGRCAAKKSIGESCAVNAECESESCDPDDGCSAANDAPLCGG